MGGDLLRPYRTECAIEGQSKQLQLKAQEDPMTLSPQAQAIYDNLIETEYKKPFSEEAPFAGLVAAMGEV